MCTLPTLTGGENNPPNRRAMPPRAWDPSPRPSPLRKGRGGITAFRAGDHRSCPARIAHHTITLTC
jgi:hypothetical protein